MKKLLSILLVMLLCLGLMTACMGGGNGNGTGDGTGDEGTTALDAAVDAVKALFTATSTSESYELEESIEVNGVTYTITWAISGEGVTLDGNTVVVPAQPAAEIAYTLTATVADAEGATKTATINLTVPAYVASYNTWAEYAAAEDGTELYVKGTVAAVLNGAIAVVDGDKAYYVTGTIADTVTVGVTVDVKGAKATTAGNYRLAATEITVTNSTAATVTAADITAAYTAAAGTNAADLVAMQGMLVTIKNVTIGSYNGTQKNYMFSIGANETYLKVNNAGGLSNAEQKVITDLHKANEGNYADVTGVIQLANGSIYLIPVATDAVANVVARQYTDAEKVALILETLKLDSVYNLATTVTVPTTGEKGGTVAWTTDNAAIAYADGTLTITIPVDYTVVNVTATITAGEVTETKTFPVVLSALENTVDILKAAYALADGKALPIANKTFEGLVTAVDTTNGVVVTLVVKNQNDYPLTVALTGETAATIVAGDTIMVTGQVKKDATGTVVLADAVLDKISSGGNLITFDLALPGSNVLFLNVKGSTANTVTVVDEDGDKVLKINKTNGNGSAPDKAQTAIDYFYPTLSEGDNVYVFEAAITLTPDAEKNGGNFETCFYTTEGESLNKVFQAEFTFPGKTAGSPIYVRGYGKINNTSCNTGDAVLTTATLGTEFTVRMEYHVDAVAPRTVVYVNDLKVIDTTTVFFSTENGKTATPVTNVTHAEMQAYTAYIGEVTLDDLNVYTYASTYTFDEEYDENEVFVDLKPWKKPLDKSGNTYEIVTDNGNKYLKVNKVNSPETCQVAVDVFDPDNKEPERIGYAEFSGKLNITRTSTGGDFEILVRAEKDTADNASLSDPQAKVAEVIITFGADGVLNAKLNGRSGGTSSSVVTLTPKQGEWFTFKLVYEVLNDKECNVVFYVNGEKVLEGKNNACLDPSNNGNVRYDSKFAEIQAYTAFTGTILYDDLALDLKSAPINWTGAVPGNPTAGELNADLGTLGTANNNDFAAEKTTTAGWVANNAQYVVDNATAGVAAVVLNGNKAAAGTLTSPVLSNGVSKVVFGYAALDAKEIALKVEILKDGKAVNSITSYLKVNKNTAYTYEWVLDTPIGGDYQIKITNLALGKAEEDAELIAIWNVTYEVATLPNYADFDFEKAGDKTNLIATGGVTVENGKMNINTASGNVHTGFIVPNHAEKNEYSEVYQYVVKFDFTFNGATVVGKASTNAETGETTYSYDLNLAFVGFLKDSSATGNGNMPYWGYLGMVAPKENGAQATGVTLYGLTFQKGETYKVEIAYVVDSGKYVITATDSTGNVMTNSFTASATAAIKELDNTMYGFNFYWRGGGTQRFKDASVTIDNAYIGIEAAPNNGRNGISKYAENSVNFNDLDDTTLVTAPITAATVTGGAFEAVDKTAKWISVIGAVGSNKYVNMGHSNKQSVTLTFGTKGAVVEKDKEFKKDTYVYELDFMYIDAFNPDNWQMKFQFAAKDINVTVNYKPAVEAKEAVYDTDGTTVITPAVEAQPAKFLLGGKEWDLNKWYTLRFEISMLDPEFHGVNDTTAVAHGYEIAIYVNNEYVTTATRATPSFTETAATETAAGKSVPNLAWESIDNTFRINTRAKAQYVEIAVDNVYYGYHTAGYEPSLKDVDAPVAGTAYKFYLNQVKANKTIYFAGEMNGFYYASTEDVLAATEVYLEAAEAEGEYYAYFMNGETKTYISLEEALNSKTGKMVCNVVFKTDKAEASKWVYNTTIKSITSTISVDGEMKTYYLGTYNNYTTFSASELSYVVDAETGALKDAYGTSSFVAHFAIYE